MTVIPFLSAFISKHFENNFMLYNAASGHFSDNCGLILSLFSPIARRPKRPSVTTLANNRLSAARWALLVLQGASLNATDHCCHFRN